MYFSLTEKYRCRQFIAGEAPLRFPASRLSAFWSEFLGCPPSPVYGFRCSTSNHIHIPGIREEGRARRQRFSKCSPRTSSSIIEMQILKPHSRLTKSVTLGWYWAVYFLTSLSNDADTHLRLKTVAQSTSLSLKFSPGHT